jgi:hypothetical protein
MYKVWGFYLLGLMLVGFSSVMFEFGVELGLPLGVGGAKLEIYAKCIW